RWARKYALRRAERPACSAAPGSMAIAEARRSIRRLALPGAVAGSDRAHGTSGPLSGRAIHEHPPSATDAICPTAGSREFQESLRPLIEHWMNDIVISSLPMAQFVVRQLEEDVKRRLQRRAKRNR